MSPRMRNGRQVVIGLGLAAVLLIWGLPHFAKTTWSEIWGVIGRCRSRARSASRCSCSWGCGATPSASRAPCTG